MKTTSGDSPQRSFSLQRVAIIVVALGVLCALSVKITANRILEQADRNSQKLMLHWFELTESTPRKLDARYVDADQDLVADSPADVAKRRSPEKLVFTFVAGPSAEQELEDWKDFVAHLSKVTGKPVETIAFDSTASQLEALSKGTLHVTGFNTGTVPAAVASHGFVPVCTFGNDDSTFGIRMQFIVSKASQIKKLEDLKGHPITFTSRDSNSGCKAALALLQDNNLLPERDYSWKFSGGHEESVAGIVSGQYEVAPVASDLLQRAFGGGSAKPEQVRIIYESERFPPATLGYAHDLTDELAAQIRQAFLDYSVGGTTLQKRFDDSHTTSFVPVVYKQDFALIRRIDAAFRRPAVEDSQ